jgi:SAM-dependent methyltransferase
MSGTCPVCGGADARPWAIAHDVEYRTSDDAYAYVRCEPCGAVYLEDPPVDRLAQIYPANYYSYETQKAGLVARVKAKLDARLLNRLLASLPATSIAALDVGGGDGVLLTQLRALDQRVAHTQVVDLDPSAKSRAVAAGHDYFCGRIEDFVADRPFDLIILLNLIEHVALPGAVLERVREALAPGGVVLVKTPNVDSLDARLFRHRDWGGYHCPRHWVLFNRANLTGLAERSGLRVRRFSYTQGAPFWTVSVLAALARRRLARVTPEHPMVEHPLFPVLNGIFAGFDLARSPFGGHPSQMFLELESA